MQVELQIKTSENSRGFCWTCRDCFDMRIGLGPGPIGQIIDHLWTLIDVRLRSNNNPHVLQIDTTPLQVERVTI